MNINKILFYLSALIILYCAYSYFESIRYSIIDLECSIDELKIEVNGIHKNLKQKDIIISKLNKKVNLIKKEK